MGINSYEHPQHRCTTDMCAARVRCSTRNVGDESFSEYVQTNSSLGGFFFLFPSLNPDSVRLQRSELIIPRRLDKIK